jgi:hypothetical protein
MIGYEFPEEVDSDHVHSQGDLSGIPVLPHDPLDNPRGEVRNDRVQVLEGRGAEYSHRPVEVATGMKGKGIDALRWIEQSSG